MKQRPAYSIDVSLAARAAAVMKVLAWRCAGRCKCARCGKWFKAQRRSTYCQVCCDWLNERQINFTVKL